MKRTKLIIGELLCSLWMMQIMGQPTIRPNEFKIGIYGYF
jgi:hypothetical protein